MAKKQELNWVQKLKTAVKAYFAEQKAKDTARTKAVEKGLRTAGLTDEEIKRLRGEK